MKLFVILASAIAVVMAQRPGYLGSGPVGYPGLASRFKDDAVSSSSTAPDVNNRLGESGGSTQKIPVDARGDTALVNRVNQWPREHRPFWVLNAEQIEAQRGGGFPNQGGFGSQQQGGFGSQQQGGFGSQRQDGFGSQQQGGFQPDNFQSRGSFDDFGNPIQSETQTIRPLQTRGSFAGSLRK